MTATAILRTILPDIDCNLFIASMSVVSSPAKTNASSHHRALRPALRARLPCPPLEAGESPELSCPRTPRSARCRGRRKQSLAVTGSCENAGSEVCRKWTDALNPLSSYRTPGFGSTADLRWVSMSDMPVAPPTASRPATLYAPSTMYSAP